MPKRPVPPAVAVFSAADPTCGAGVYADVRAVAAQGCVPFAVLCGVAPQDLGEAREAEALSGELIRRQFAAIRPAKLAVIKIGALFSAEAVQAVADCLADKPEVPVVWDPVLSPTSGVRFADPDTREAAKKLLLPRAFVMTPNLREARALAAAGPMLGPSLSAKKILALGAGNVLVTDSEPPRVRCLLYGQKRAVALWQAMGPRVRGEFHGSGCRFAATLAARLARGDQLPAAADFAHRHTLDAIARALSLPQLGKQKLLYP